MKQNYEKAMAAVLKWEGGFVNHPKDPGGATNMGITRATLASWRGEPVSVEDVRALTMAEALAIYRKRYADVVAFDSLPSGVDLCVLDFAINSGPERSAKMLQACLGVRQDGRIGPATIKAAADADRVLLIRSLCVNRLKFLRGLKAWTTFGVGWGRRVAEIERLALAMANAPAKPGPAITAPAAGIGAAIALAAAAIAAWWAEVEDFFRHIFGG